MPSTHQTTETNDENFASELKAPRYRGKAHRSFCTALSKVSPDSPRSKPLSHRRIEKLVSAAQRLWESNGVTTDQRERTLHLPILIFDSSSQSGLGLIEKAPYLTVRRSEDAAEWNRLAHRLPMGFPNLRLAYDIVALIQNNASGMLRINKEENIQEVVLPTWVVTDGAPTKAARQILGHELHHAGNAKEKEMERAKGENENETLLKIPISSKRISVTFNETSYPYEPSFKPLSRIAYGTGYRLDEPFAQLFTAKGDKGDKLDPSSQQGQAYSNQLLNTFCLSLESLVNVGNAYSAVTGDRSILDVRDDDGEGIIPLALAKIVSHGDTMYFFNIVGQLIISEINFDGDVDEQLREVLASAYDELYVTALNSFVRYYNFISPEDSQEIVLDKFTESLEALGVPSITDLAPYEGDASLLSGEEQVRWCLSRHIETKDPNLLVAALYLIRNSDIEVSQDTLRNLTQCTLQTDKTYLYNETISSLLVKEIYLPELSLMARKLRDRSEWSQHALLLYASSSFFESQSSAIRRETMKVAENLFPNSWVVLALKGSQALTNKRYRQSGDFLFRALRKAQKDSQCGRITSSLALVYLIDEWGAYLSAIGDDAGAEHATNLALKVANQVSLS